VAVPREPFTGEGGAGAVAQQAFAAGGGLPLTEFGPSAMRYYLVIEAMPGTDLSQPYPVTIELTQGVKMESIFLPLIQRTP